MLGSKLHHSAEPNVGVFEAEVNITQDMCWMFVTKSGGTKRKLQKCLLQTADFRQMFRPFVLTCGRFSIASVAHGLNPVQDLSHVSKSRAVVASGQIGIVGRSRRIREVVAKRCHTHQFHFGSLVVHPS